MAGDLADRDLGGYITFGSSGLECLDQLGLAGDGLRLFALGRHCLEAVCRASRPRKLFLPTFTCSSVKKVAVKQGIVIQYYSISEAFVPQLDVVQQDELLVLNNYFGLSAYSDALDAWLRKAAPAKCLIDNTQSFGVRNQFPGRLSFISPRKFLPVTDGGILFDPDGRVTEDCMPEKQDVSWRRMEWLFRAIDERGRSQSYAAYAEFRKGLQDLEYMRLSETTRHLLSVFDIEAAVRRRNENFRRLRDEMAIHYSFGNLAPLSDFSPIGYPVFVDDAREAQASLSKHHIYAIRYWPDLDEDAGTNKFERDLLKHLLIVPIDTSPSEVQLSILKTFAK